jgi:hypothetical protein
MNFAEQWLRIPIFSFTVKEFAGLFGSAFFCEGGLWGQGA